MRGKVVRNPDASAGLVSNTTQKSVLFSIVWFINKNDNTIMFGIIAITDSMERQNFLTIPFCNKSTIVTITKKMKFTRILLSASSLYAFSANRKGKAYTMKVKQRVARNGISLIR